MELINHTRDENNGLESAKVNTEVQRSLESRGIDKNKIKQLMSYADSLARKIDSEFSALDPNRSNNARAELQEINRQFKDTFDKFVNTVNEHKNSLWSKLPFSGDGGASKDLLGFKYNPQQMGTQEKPKPSNSDGITAGWNLADTIAKGKIGIAGNGGKL